MDSEWIPETAFIIGFFVILPISIIYSQSILPQISQDRKTTVETLSNDICPSEYERFSIDYQNETQARMALVNMVSCRWKCSLEPQSSETVWLTCERIR